MALATETNQISKLFSNRVLSRLERLQINSNRRFTDKRRGEHLSGRGGTSIEFSDYRNYIAGDDVRFVDWNIFARLNRPYLKLYRQEEEMHVVILIDASTSMKFENKFTRCTQLAGAFAIMGLFANEQVSIYAFNSQNTRPEGLRPTSGKGNMQKILNYIENIQNGGDSPVEHGVDQFLKYHSGRGVLILLSDFLTIGNLKKACNSIYNSGLELFAIQILGESEIDPIIAGDVRLLDCETEQPLDVSLNANLIKIYQEYRLDHEAYIAELCKKRAGRFLTINSNTNIEHILFDTLCRKGWIR